MAAAAASSQLYGTPNDVLRRVGTLCLGSPAPPDADRCLALPDALLEAPLYYGASQLQELGVFRRAPRGGRAHKPWRALTRAGAGAARRTLSRRRSRCTRMRRRRRRGAPGGGANGPEQGTDRLAAFRRAGEPDGQPTARTIAGAREAGAARRAAPAARSSRAAPGRDALLAPPPKPPAHAPPARQAQARAKKRPAPPSPPRSRAPAAGGRPATAARPPPALRRPSPPPPRARACWR